MRIQDKGGIDRRGNRRWGNQWKLHWYLSFSSFFLSLSLFGGSARQRTRERERYFDLKRKEKDVSLILWMRISNENFLLIFFSFSSRLCSIQGDKDRIKHERMLFRFKKKKIEKEWKDISLIWWVQAMKIIRRCLSFSPRLFAIQSNEDRGHEYFDLKIGIEKKNWKNEGETFLWFHPSDFF